MNNLMNNKTVHIPAAQMLERSRWYGPNLITLLTTSAETDGAFSLIKCTLCKGFEPPLNVHSKEDESYVIIKGEINYEAGEQIINAKPGDYVHLPKSVPHTFKLVSDVATILLLITPGGFEEMFMQFSRPALAMQLPSVPTEQPGKEFFERMEKLNSELGVIMLPTL